MLMDANELEWEFGIPADTMLILGPDWTETIDGEPAWESHDAVHWYFKRRRDRLIKALLDV